LRLKRLIARTEKQKDEIKVNLSAGSDTAAARAGTPHDLRTMTPILQFEGQLKANQQEIEDTKREMRGVEAQISLYQGRLNEAPIREQQLAEPDP